ncbi:hypothetical protein GOP47_0005017 [Adiantum capillus-veneris]|uniref:Peptidase M14 domain-containing protein n=1 Tax=Adiantum capillus-veneris TaxID=13818 RepID=A0A9D4ZL04_ADICA|nr:hypothetical protein GOP47_0005017 [Adiantum capillus-veneris]
MPNSTLNYAVILALLLLPVITGNHIKGRNITQIDTDLYHQRDALLQEIEALAFRHPQSMLVESWKSEVDGYSSEILVATVEHRSNIKVEKKKYRLLLSFGQHGRELITSEVALRLLRILVGEKEPAVFNNVKIRMLLQKLIIKIIPLENYNGRKIVENGHLCERKNGRGVDINRNWSLDWGKKEQDFDPAEEFPGNAPFSEPETRIMRDVASSFKPHLWINVHSGMQAMFMPYDHKSDLPDPRVAEPMKLLLQELNYLHCNNSCVIGSGGGSVGYLAHGTATDYMYEVLGVPLAFTFEIYGDMEAPNEDCFRMFNPVTVNTYESIVTNWSMAFITIFVKLESLLSSWPLFLSKQNDGALLGRKFNLSKGFTFGHSGRAREWTNDVHTLFEFIVLFSTSYLAFVWYIYLKPWDRGLQRLRAMLPSNTRQFS